MFVLNTTDEYNGFINCTNKQIEDINMIIKVSGLSY